MLSKCFSYYNYKITQNIDIPILFFCKERLKRQKIAK